MPGLLFGRYFGSEEPLKRRLYALPSHVIILAREQRSNSNWMCWSLLPRQISGIPAAAWNSVESFSAPLDKIDQEFLHIESDHSWSARICRHRACVVLPVGSRIRVFSVSARYGATTSVKICLRSETSFTWKITSTRS